MRFVIIMRKTNEVNKVYVGMPQESVLKLETETCIKCHHLVDDHFLPVNTFKSKTNKIYKCRNCGCEIT